MNARVVLTVIAAAALSACSSTPAGSRATSPQASVGGGGSLAATPGASAAGISVDLVFSGTLSFVAKGSAGRCSGVTRSDGSVSFGFEATEADYPGLGTDYSMANLQGDYVDIKWLVDATTAYGESLETPIVLSADHHSVRIDGDLAPGSVGGGPVAGPEHVSGTITCS